MTIQDTHLLVAQARMEADNPAFKVWFSFGLSNNFADHMLRHTFPCMSVLGGSHVHKDDYRSFIILQVELLFTRFY
jgi:hypothetical protein